MSFDPNPQVNKNIPLNSDRLIHQSIQTALPGALADMVAQLQKIPSEFRPNDPRLKLRALILTSDRESAQALDFLLQPLLQNTSLRSLLVDGTLQKGTQFSALRTKTDILVSTPAYLPKYVEKEAVNLQHIQIFMLVGLDKIFGHGYAEGLEKLMIRMPWQRQNIAITETLKGDVGYFAYSILKIDRPTVESENYQIPVERERPQRRGGDRDSRRDSREPRRPRENQRDSRHPRDNHPQKSQRDNNRSNYKNRHHQDRYLDAFSGEDKILSNAPVKYQTQKSIDLATSNPDNIRPKKNFNPHHPQGAPKKKGFLNRINPLKWLEKEDSNTPKDDSKKSLGTPLPRKRYSENRQDDRRPR